MNSEFVCLEKRDPKLLSVLLNGVIQRNDQWWSALPREVIANPDGNDSIIFEIIPPYILQQYKPSKFQVIWKAFRLKHLTYTWGPQLGVLAYGFFKHWNFKSIEGSLAFLGVLCLQASANAFNDVEDYLRLIDFPGVSGRTGVIQKGWLSAKQVRELGFITFFISIGLGAPAVLQSESSLLWISIFGAVGVMSYSNSPFKMKYRGYSEWILFLMTGPVLSYALAKAAFGYSDGGILFLGMSFGFLTLATHYAASFLEPESNLFPGPPLILKRLGFPASRHLLLLSYLAALFSLFIGWILGYFPLSLGILVSFSIPFAVRSIDRLYKASGPSSALLSGIASNAISLHFLIGILICLAFLISLL